MALGPITSWQMNGVTVEQWQTLFSWAPKSLQMVTAAVKLRHLLLGRKAMTNLDSVLKSRDKDSLSVLKSRDFADKGLYSQSYGFFQ